MKSFANLLKPLALAASLCVAVAASAQNIVQDPGFELSPGTSGAPGGFAPVWTLVPPAGTPATNQLSNVGTDSAFAHSGTKHANLEYSEAAAPATGSLLQTLNTVAGRLYQVSFWLSNFSAAPVNTFQVLINGIALTTNFTNSISSPAFPADGLYHQVFAQFTATSGTSTLEFRYHHDSDFWSLDDISVAAPENGTTLWLILPVVGGVFFMHRRIRRGAAGC